MLISPAHFQLRIDCHRGYGHPHGKLYYTLRRFRRNGLYDDSSLNSKATPLLSHFSVFPLKLSVKRKQIYSSSRCSMLVTELPQDNEISKMASISSSAFCSMLNLSEESPFLVLSQQYRNKAKDMTEIEKQITDGFDLPELVKGHFSRKVQESIKRDSSEKFEPLVSKQVDIYTGESEASECLDVKESFSEGRINHGNKGRTPWNKGRQHSEVTKQLIGTRTKEALQDPIIRDKLKQSLFTLSNDVEGKRQRSLEAWWDKLRSLNHDRKQCVTEWREAIAEAARVGDIGSEVYQWDSYSIIKRTLCNEWKKHEQLQRKQDKACKTGKSMEHRQKISMAIKAKWADPIYRQKTNAGLKDHLESTKRPSLSEEHRHKIAAKLKEKWADPNFRQRRGVSIAKAKTRVKTRRLPNSSPPSNSGSEKKQSLGKIQERQRQLVKIKCAPKPSFGKHLSSSNAEEISPTLNSSVEKNLGTIRRIRAERLAFQAQRKEAAHRAWMLLEAAEKAARNLEFVAANDKEAHAALLQTRELLKEAVLSLQTAKLARNVEIPTIGIDANSMVGCRESEMLRLHKDIELVED